LKSQALFYLGGKKKKMIINPIKKRREEKGLTQAELAMLVGASQVYISQFETGGLSLLRARLKRLPRFWASVRKLWIKNYTSSMKV